MTFEQSTLLARARATAKVRHLSSKTETAYVNHIRRFAEFHENEDLYVKRADKIRAFLSHLQQNERLGDSTRNQARCALLFLYRDVFGQAIPAHFDEIKRAPVGERQPIFFTHEEIKTVFANLSDMNLLVAALMYGSGLRLSEAVALRVRDVDFEQFEITVRDPNSGAKDRKTVLPKSIVRALKRQFVKVKFTHEDDCFSGFGKAKLPGKALPQSSESEREWTRQYVFPAAKLIAAGKDFQRLHIAESTVQKAVAEAFEKAKIDKPGSCQSLRYSFAARLFENNHSAHTIQNLLGHKNLKTTMSYLIYDSRRGNKIRSPLDGN
jgi:integrase